MKLSLLVVNLPAIVERFFPDVNVKHFTYANKIHFSRENYLATFFHDDEIAIINQFTTYKRQIEWICGRLAIKKMVEAYTNRKYNSRKIIISSKENGAPLLHAFPCWSISISHSNHYAIGAICYKNNKRIGIDIEKIDGQKSNEFLQLAFSKHEIESMQDQSPEQIYINWTIKESFLKLIEMGFHENLKRVEVINNYVYYYNQLMSNLVIKTNKIDNEYIYSLVVHKYNEDLSIEIGKLDAASLIKSHFTAVA